MTIDFYDINMSPPCRAVRMAAKHLNIKLNSIEFSHEDLLKPEFLKVRL
jgi:hypothetical protein